MYGHPSGGAKSLNNFWRPIVWRGIGRRWGRWGKIWRTIMRRGLGRRSNVTGPKSSTTSPPVAPMTLSHTSQYPSRWVNHLMRRRPGWRVFIVNARTVRSRRWGGPWENRSQKASGTNYVPPYNIGRRPWWRIMNGWRGSCCIPWGIVTSKIFQPW